MFNVVCAIQFRSSSEKYLSHFFSVFVALSLSFFLFFFSSFSLSTVSVTFHTAPIMPNFVLTFTHYITKYAMNGTLCIHFTRFDFTRAFFCAPFSASHLQKTWSIHMKSTRRHIDRQTDRHNWIFLIWMLVFCALLLWCYMDSSLFFSLVLFFGMCATLCARSTMYWN